MVFPQCPLSAHSPRDALGEPRPTQVDASVGGDSCVLFFECKFTEPDGGSCSQPDPLRGNGPNRGIVQCSGDYALQINPVNKIEARCSLSGKGIRYWDVVPRVLAMDARVDHHPCPFRGGAYHFLWDELCKLRRTGYH